MKLKCIIPKKFVNMQRVGMMIYKIKPEAEAVTKETVSRDRFILKV